MPTMSTQQQQQQQQRLTAPVREINRAHLQLRAQPVMEFIGESLRWAGFHGIVRVQMGPNGKPRIVVTVQGLGTTEAGLMLPMAMDGFDIRVV
jgi:hypothetical protein